MGLEESFKRFDPLAVADLEIWSTELEEVVWRPLLDDTENVAEVGFDDIVSKVNTDNKYGWDNLYTRINYTTKDWFV